jgi:hypothetical protein
MPAFNLQAYLERFSEVCNAKFNRTYDFAKLERDFADLGKGRRWLAARDVMKVFEPSATPFGRYWPQPAEKELDQTLKKTRLFLAPIPDHPIDLVNDLLAIFRSTAIASILLRFANPERFGIISSPVVYLLQVQRANTADLYMAYCEELEQWRKHFHMRSVAETDMALWSFYELTDGPAKTGGAPAALREFASDVWVQSRRLSHVLRPFLERHGRLELARILGHEDPNLAGKIAGEEYERLLRGAAHRLYPKWKFDEGWARKLVERLALDGHVEAAGRVALQEVWEVRNLAVHATSEPTWAQVDKMIDNIESICLRWQETLR